MSLFGLFAFVTCVSPLGLAGGGEPAVANVAAKAATKELSTSSDTSSAAQAPVAKPIDGKLAAVSPKDLAALKALDKKYKSSTSITKNVEKTVRLGLLNQERKSSGKLWMAGGRLRMELEGSEKTLLVINKKNLWAVTYPPAEFKDAAVQVIKGDVTSKKGQSQAVLGLLTQGGLLKSFKPTGVQTQDSGETIYFLQPKKEQTDLKRAQVSVSKDKQSIVEIHFWDERDNETQFNFTDVTFGKKVNDKLFTFSPPANADVMNL